MMRHLTGPEHTTIIIIDSNFNLIGRQIKALYLSILWKAIQKVIVLKQEVGSPKGTQGRWVPGRHPSCSKQTVLRLWNISHRKDERIHLNTYSRWNPLVECGYALVPPYSTFILWIS